MQRPATSVADYLAALPPDRRAEIVRIYDLVRGQLPRGYEEGLLYGMIGWYVPLSRYPVTYNGHPLATACLAAQKHHNALYLTAVYGNPAIEAGFRDGFAAAGKKLEMGKSCVRFKTADALAEDVIGETIAAVSVVDLIAIYEYARGPGKGAKPKSARAARARATPVATKPAKKRTAKKAKPTTTKKATKKKATKKATKKKATKKPTTKPATKKKAKRRANARGAR